MKIANIAIIFLWAMAVLIPTAKAQNYALVPSAKPATPSYSGIPADILGLRIGMTLSQAEAVAAKKFPGSTRQEFKSAVSTNFQGGNVSSQPYVSRVDVHYGPSDLVRLYFTNQATGNVLYGLTLSLFYPDVSKAPVMTAVGANLVKKYGPASAQSVGRYTWHFGKHALKPCSLGRCVDLGVAAPGMDKRALQLGVVLGIDASVASNRANDAKVGWINMGMEDYQLRNDSETAADKQLKTLAMAQYNKAAAAKAKADKALTKNANNVLDVKGLIAGQALAVNCQSDGVFANTFSDADALAASTFKEKYIAEALFRRFNIGPVTYNGKQYNMKVMAFGQPPGTTNADVEFDPVNGQGKRILSGNTLVGGSVAIARFGLSAAYTFDHAVLKLEGPSVPPNATATINGKAYCNGNVPPLPQDLVVPTQALTGTYGEKASQGPITALDFVSKTVVKIQSASKKMQGTYKYDGTLLQVISTSGESGILKLDANGCFDGPGHTKYCRMAAQKPAATPAETEAMKAKQELEKAAAIAAAQKRAALKLVPKF